MASVLEKPCSLHLVVCSCNVSGHLHSLHLVHEFRLLVHLHILHLVHEFKLW